MYSVYLLIGSNEGNRLQLLTDACRQIEKTIGRLINCSGIYETEAWGREGLPSHLNLALYIQTPIEPLFLLEKVKRIEAKLGRRATQKWGLRKIDIDIIYFENFIIQRPQLQVPHPLLHLRRFVLTPLAEIAPNFLHPVLLKTNRELLSKLEDPLKVRLLVIDAFKD